MLGSYLSLIWIIDILIISQQYKNCPFYKRIIIFPNKSQVCLFSEFWRIFSLLSVTPEKTPRQTRCDDTDTISKRPKKYYALFFIFQRLYWNKFMKVVLLIHPSLTQSKQCLACPAYFESTVFFAYQDPTFFRVPSPYAFHSDCSRFCCW